MTRPNPIRIGTMDDITICSGTCGRKLHATNKKVLECPEAVSRFKQNYCRACWDRLQAERPMTKKEMDTLRGLESYMARRRARLQRLDRIPEQFRKQPILPELNVKFDTVQEFRLTEHVKGKLLPRRRNRMASEQDFREGSVRYVKDTKGFWRFSIVGDNNEVMAQSESYASLGNAKRGAKALIRKLNVREPDE